jgi:hypothetical protein
MQLRFAPARLKDVGDQQGREGPRLSVSMLKVEAAIKIVYTVNREVKRSGNL